MSFLAPEASVSLSLRTYSFRWNGHRLECSFPHVKGMRAEDLTSYLNQEFQTWLENHAPGEYAAGRITGIEFSDQ
jgi:hypothetical protein